MKIQIDTERKVITFIEDCTLRELYDYAKDHNIQDYGIETQPQQITWYPYFPEAPFYFGDGFITTSLDDEEILQWYQNTTLTSDN